MILRYECPLCKNVVDVQRAPKETGVVTSCDGTFHLNVERGTMTITNHEPTAMNVVGILDGFGRPVKSNG